MSLTLALDAKTEEFRKEVREFLVKNPPPAASVENELDVFVATSRAWQKKLAAAKLLGTFFPVEFGGRGFGLVEESVAQEELARAASPQLAGLFGLTMVGPVLIKHGSQEQKVKFLSRILSGEDLWCQGFSEPEAGSDLAAIKTTAVVDGDSYLVNGQKVWTSFAQYAEWCFILARTDSSVKKHEGLSYFLVPMNAPGINVRPLKQITGESEFNEVFFDNVKVDRSQMVGKPGQGWEIAISTLMYERVVLTLSRHLQSEQALSELSKKILSMPDNFSLKVQLGKLKAKMSAVRALALSHLVQYQQGASPGPEGSMDKLFWSEAFQEITRFALEICPEDVLNGGSKLQRYLYSKGRTIAAGTSEIQRNIIAERVVGLPRK
jgi:alkylation response protein AidB-like acyl-CoA dehydrogenase